MDMPLLTAGGVDAAWCNGLPDSKVIVAGSSHALLILFGR